MGQRRALIIANSAYDDEGLGRLRSPAADAQALADVLGDPNISDFDVRILHDESASVVQEQVEDLFLEGRPDDLLLLHFSCHGVKSESGELFFAARNTRPNRLGSTAVPADFVRRCMRESRSRSIVLLLDCCYGGAFSQGVSVRAAGDVDVLRTLSGGRGRAVITASNAIEYAFEGDRLAEDHVAQPSVFTSALVRGLSTGEADRDEDGLISLNELYDYVFEQVRMVNPHQTPSRDVEMQGELYLARSGRRRITPLPMPQDLAAAVSDPNPFTRLGAIAELRARLSHTNLEVAAGAHAALTAMADRDVRAVAEAAAQALKDVQLSPSTRQLSISPETPGVLTLAGPPLARACTAAASEPWIRLAEAEHGWSISLRQPPSVGAQGSIKLAGPTGQATVVVIAESAVGRRVPDPRPTVAQPPVIAELLVAATPPLTKPKGSLWCGVLAFLAALLMLTALIIKIPQLAQHIQLSESPVLDWVFLLAQTIIAIVLTIAAGVCVLLPATRTIGLGALVGLGATASLSLISSVETFYTVTNQGLIVLAAVQLSAYAVVLVVAIIAAVTARRHRAVRSGLRSASRGWLAVVALGAAVTGGSLILHDIQKLYRHSSTAYVVAEDLSIALLGIVVSVGAACTLPRSWSLAMLAGWAGPYGAYLLGKYGELGITHEPGSTAQLVAVIGFGAVAILVPIASESCALKADATHFLPTSKRLEVYWLQQAFALQY